MLNKTEKIPQYVINWTDKYFHQSAFDIPLEFPSDRIVSFLSRFKRKEKSILFRGMNKFNQENFTKVESWTYDKEVAKRYAKEQGGKVIKKLFDFKNILLDTTFLGKEEKNLLGYDYQIDDKEVLISKQKNMDKKGNRQKDWRFS